MQQLGPLAERLLISCFAISSVACRSFGLAAGNESRGGSSDEPTCGFGHLNRNTAHRSFGITVPPEPR